MTADDGGNTCWRVRLLFNCCRGIPVPAASHSLPLLLEATSSQDFVAVSRR